MRYINKNQITQLVIEKMDKIERYEIIFVFIGGATTLCKTNKRRVRSLIRTTRINFNRLDYGL